MSDSERLLGTALVPLQFELEKARQQARKWLAPAKQKFPTQGEVYPSADKPVSKKSPLPQGSEFTILGTDKVLQLRYQLIVEGHVLVRRVFTLNVKTKRAKSVEAAKIGRVSPSMSRRLSSIADDRLLTLAERIDEVRAARAIPRVLI